MNKQKFLDALRKELSGLPQNDIDERIHFYSEIIDDRIEEGMTEEDAVAAVGSVNDIVTQIVADTPLTKIAKERIKPKRRLTALEIVLIVLGSPIWLSIGISIIAAIFSIYVSLWTLIISLWAVFVSLVASSVGCIGAGVVFICTGNVSSGIATIGAAIAVAGLSIFAFFGCKLVTKGLCILTKKFALWTKNCFKGKGAAK